MELGIHEIEPLRTLNGETGLELEVPILLPLEQVLVLAPPTDIDFSRQILGTRQEARSLVHTRSR